MLEKDRIQFFANHDGDSLLGRMERVLKEGEVHCLDALVGWLGASGYFRVQPLLEGLGQVRILVGIDVQGILREKLAKGEQYRGKPSEVQAAWLADQRQNIAVAGYSQEVERGMRQFVEDIQCGRVLLRAHPNQEIRAKLYLFRPAEFGPEHPGTAITGSSNLTDRGLIEAFEFNAETTAYAEVKFATDTFERLWEEGVEIGPPEAEVLLDSTHLGHTWTPYEVYLKLLMEYFDKSVDLDSSVMQGFPNTYKRLAYQVDAVQQGLMMLREHHGMILADVVGLGKTVVAASILFEFIQQQGPRTRALIVFPPALKKNWQVTIKAFGLRNYVDYVTVGSLHKVVEGHADYSSPGAYDIVIVDESHKFRNDGSQMYQNLQWICKYPRNHAMPGEGSRKKVLLISATPLNNRPEDIASQLYLFQDARQSTLEDPQVRDLQKYFSQCRKTYQKLLNAPDLDVEGLKRLYFDIRDRVLKQLVFRRTRQDILENETYWEDLKAKGEHFPSVQGPHTLTYTLDEDLVQLLASTVDYITQDEEEGGLGFFRYRALEFITTPDHPYVRNGKRISGQLSGIMRALLVKRLESSFTAFKITLERFANRNQAMLDMLANDKVYIAPDLDVNKFLEEAREEELEARILESAQENPQHAVYRRRDFHGDLELGLIRDQERLNKLCADWKGVTEDRKWSAFAEELAGLMAPELNLEGKLVVFTESADTAEYVAGQLQAHTAYRSVAISSANQAHMSKRLRASFDPNIPTNEQKSDLDIVVTTDVLAEGVNLHRANVLVNYDIPWNATRVMQRTGRINRLGTQAEAIHVYNYRPSVEGDAYLGLHKRAMQKIQSFHSAFGGHSKVYSEEEELIENVLHEVSETEGESNDWLKRLEELRAYKRNHPEEYARIKALPPKGYVMRQVKPGIAPKTTLVYLRTPNRNAFYLLTEDDEPRELSFFKAVELFHALPEERAKGARTEWHHTHVGDAEERFRDSRLLQATHAQLGSGDSLSVQEQNALRLLSKVLKAKHERLTPHFKKNLETTRAIIVTGTYRQLRNELAQLYRDDHDQAGKMPLSELLDALGRTLQNYPIAKIRRLMEAQHAATEKDLEAARTEEAALILVESFDA